jgi:SAM-dependent methyltransferase
LSAAPPAPSAEADRFDAMFATSDDPWRFRSRWYEQRKRALTLAVLTCARYRRAFEPGCANGELSAALAGRCDELIAWDLSERAVAIARQRVCVHAHVTVAQGVVPDEWPAGRFDLVVVSEMAYYLPLAAQQALARRAADSLEPQGTLLACHWRRPLEDGSVQGEPLHAILQAASGLTSVAHYGDADMVLDVWSNDPRSVAEQEGLPGAAQPGVTPGRTTDSGETA